MGQVPTIYIFSLKYFAAIKGSDQPMICVDRLIEPQGKTLMFWLVYVIYRQINLKGDFVMKNVEMTVEGETLIIKVDLSKDFGPSKSGKTIIIASTEGNVSVPERGEKIGLNVYRYPD